MDDVRDNPERSRYELEVSGETAIADYRLEGDTLLITHTHTPPALRGQGIAGRLVAGLLSDVRARGLKVRPLCSYVVDYLERHPDQKDLVSS